MLSNVNSLDKPIGIIANSKYCLNKKYIYIIIMIIRNTLSFFADLRDLQIFSFVFHGLFDFRYLNQYHIVVIFSMHVIIYFRLVS